MGLKDRLLSQAKPTPPAKKPFLNGKPLERVDSFESSLKSTWPHIERSTIDPRLDESQKSDFVSENPRAVESIDLQQAQVKSGLDRGDEVETLPHQIRKMESENKQVYVAEMQRADELRVMKKLVKDQAAEIDRMRQELLNVKSGAERDRRRMEHEHAYKIDELNRGLQMEIEHAKREASDRERVIVQQYESQLRNLVQERSAEKNAAELECTKTVHELNEAHAVVVSKLEQEQKRSVLELRDAHEEKCLRMAHDHEEHLEKVYQENYKVKADAEMTERRVLLEHTKAIEELRDDHTVMLSNLKQEHQQNIRHLQQELEELNGALLNRDDEVYQARLFSLSGLPRKSDDEIRNQVHELQQMVDDLSRAEWKPSPETWTDRVFREPANQQYGQRLLRKAIVQDMLWTLLHQWIFCSPFRMCGEEGKKLECEWNEQCGKEDSSGDELYTWPSPSIKAERWRYMTVKECREILSTPILSHLDKRAELKLGFQMSQDKLITALADELGQVVQLTERELKLVRRLAKKAAVIWIDFAMHRCRIVVRPTALATKSTAEKMSTIQEGFALTERPAVGRYGNVKGVELDRFTIIEDCEGSKLDLS